MTQFELALDGDIGFILEICRAMRIVKKVDNYKIIIREMINIQFCKRKVREIEEKHFT